MHLYERLNYLTAKQINYNLHFKQPVLSIKGSVIKLEAKRKKKPLNIQNVKVKKICFTIQMQFNNMHNLFR